MKKFYSAKGDTGTTALLGGQRVPKSDLRIMANGELDELSAHLGVLRSWMRDNASGEMLLQIQKDLSMMMGEIAMLMKDKPSPASSLYKRVEWIEAQIDRIGDDLEMPCAFLFPGDDQAQAFANLSRAVSRRAERQLIALKAEYDLSEEILFYMNRLSSLLFVLVLFLTQE